VSSTADISFIGRSRWSLAANSLTLIRFVGAPILTALVLERNPWWLTFWLGWFLGFTDFLDGHLARRASPTRVGAFLDPLADKVVVLMVGFALVWLDRFSWLPITLIAAREVAIMVYRSYWGRRGLAIPARRSAKYKTLVQGVALAAALCPPLEPHPWVADSLLWLAVAFTLVSGLQYAIDGRGALRSTGQR
jgi:CDP-diacylglycerol--glycerol-3-phosphate 3-phosphatidyltransferase